MGHDNLRRLCLGQVERSKGCSALAIFVCRPCAVPSLDCSRGRCHETRTTLFGVSLLVGIR